MTNHNPTDRLVVYQGVIMMYSTIQWQMDCTDEVQDAERKDISKWIKHQKNLDKKKGRLL